MGMSWDIRKILGKGGFAFVFKGAYRDKQLEKLIPVAVKRIQELDVNPREENALRNLRHPNVIKLFHVVSDADFRHVTKKNL